MNALFSKGHSKQISMRKFFAGTFFPKTSNYKFGSFLISPLFVNAHFYSNVYLMVQEGVGGNSFQILLDVNFYPPRFTPSHFHLTRRSVATVGDFSSSFLSLAGET